MNKENIEILGKKIGMTQIFDDSNRLIPVTVIEVTPNYILQIKTKETDGYNAIQLGFGAQKEQRKNKADLGHIKKAGVAPLHTLFEFRTEDVSKFKVGDVIGLDRFSEGEKVDVIGITKGRGFQGVVKRFRYGGGPASHGSMSHRRGGSYGNRQWPGEVRKGQGMPGRMGGDQVTVQNLIIVKVIADKNIVLIRGSFPGKKGGFIRIRKAKKAKQAILA